LNFSKKRNGIAGDEDYKVAATIAVIAFLVTLCGVLYLIWWGNSGQGPTQYGVVTSINHPDNSPVWIVTINDQTWNFNSVGSNGNSPNISSVAFNNLYQLQTGDCVLYQTNNFGSVMNSLTPIPCGDNTA